MELNKSSVILGIVMLLALVSFVFADTYFFTDANHNNNSIYNVSQINSTLYCDDTGCYELTELNTTTTETDPYWTANQSSYFTKANINSFGYYNSTDFSISDYATNVKVDSLGNFSAWDKDYNDLINTPTFTNDTWVDTYFVRFTELVGQIGNWTLDKVDYYTSAEVDTEITNANTSMKTYTDGTFITQANEGNLNVNHSTTSGTATTWDSETSQVNLNVNSSSFWDLLNSPNDINAGDITDDGTYRLQSWNNLTGIPHATPTNGDTTHFSLADEIYDFVIALGYIASLVADTSPQLGGYLDTNGQNIGSTADEIENVYVATNSRIYFGDGQEASIYYNGTVLVIG